MLAWACVAAALAGGTVLAGWAEREWNLPSRLAAGVPIGLTLFGLAGYPLALWQGMEVLPCVAAAALAGLPGLGLLVPSWRTAWSLPRRIPKRHNWLEPAAFLLAGAALLASFDRAVIESPAGWGTGVGHNFGDLPFHIGVIQGFVLGENLPPEHPELAGAPLTYPFLIDFGAAQLVRLGLTLPAALRLQNGLLALALLVLAHRWARTFAGERGAALLAPGLLFLNGGFGFASLARDLRDSGRGLFALLLELPHDYTILPTGELRFGNLITTLLVPQRSLLLGLPLALAIWTLLFEACTSDTHRARRLVAAGGLTALLPLVHAHTFAVALAVAAALAVLMSVPLRTWGAYFLPALALGLPQLLGLIAGTSMQASSFIGIELGWDRGSHDPLWFWFTNAGLFLPLLIAALCWPGLLRPGQRRFFVPFACCFVFPNLLRLSPWIWDNIKFLVHWYAASVPLVALLLTRLVRTGRRGLAMAGIATAVLVASGALDVWRVASRQMNLPLFDTDALGFARLVAARTPAGARFLGSPTHDSPLLLAGRRLLLGYPGHIWSQGLSSGSREADIARIYAGEQGAAGLLRRYQVGFILLGPQERRQQAVSDGFFQQLPVVAQAGPYALFDARHLSGE